MKTFYVFFHIDNMLLTLESKIKLIIELYRKGANIRDIAKQVHMSFSDIGKIIRQHTGQKEPAPEKSNTAKAFRLFSKGVALTDVTIILDIPPSEVETIYLTYLHLKDIDHIVKFFDEIKGYTADFLRFVDIMKNCKPEKEKILELFDFDNALKIHAKQMNDNFHEMLKGGHELDKFQRENRKLK